MMGCPLQGSLRKQAPLILQNIAQHHETKAGDHDQKDAGRDQDKEKRSLLKSYRLENHYDPSPGSLLNGKSHQMGRESWGDAPIIPGDEASSTVDAVSPAAGAFGSETQDFLPIGIGQQDKRTERNQMAEKTLKPPLLPSCSFALHLV
jgi:hypothetical protein